VNLLLQQLLVGALVVACALFSAWRLLSVPLRLRTLARLERLPGLGGASWIARLRARAHARQLDACGGCAGHPAKSTQDAASRNRTRGALRR
jgi:hypothetical protein